MMQNVERRRDATSEQEHHEVFGFQQTRFFSSKTRARMARPPGRRLTMGRKTQLAHPQPQPKPPFTPRASLSPSPRFLRVPTLFYYLPTSALLAAAYDLQRGEHAASTAHYTTTATTARSDGSSDVSSAVKDCSCSCCMASISGRCQPVFHSQNFLSRSFADCDPIIGANPETVQCRRPRALQRLLGDSDLVDKAKFCAVACEAATLVTSTGAPGAAAPTTSNTATAAGAECMALSASTIARSGANSTFASEPDPLSPSCKPFRQTLFKFDDNGPVEAREQCALSHMEFRNKERTTLEKIGPGCTTAKVCSLSGKMAATMLPLFQQNRHCACEICALQLNWHSGGRFEAYADRLGGWDCDSTSAVVAACRPCVFPAAEPGCAAFHMGWVKKAADVLEYGGGQEELRKCLKKEILHQPSSGIGDECTKATVCKAVGIVVGTRASH